MKLDTTIEEALVNAVMIAELPKKVGEKSFNMETWIHENVEPKYTYSSNKFDKKVVIFRAVAFSLNKGHLNLLVDELKKYNVIVEPQNFKNYEEYEQI
jgi:hypothetical protein